MRVALKNYTFSFFPLYYSPWFLSNRVNNLMNFGLSKKSCPTITNYNTNRAELKVLTLPNIFLETSWTTSWHFLTLPDTSWQFLINREAPKYSWRFDRSCHLLTIWHILSLLDDIVVVLFASHWLLDGVSVASWCILRRLDNSGGEKVVTNQEEVFKNHQENPRICREVAKKQSRNRQKFTANIVT